MKARVPLALAVLLLGCAADARANSIASVVVRPDGAVLFTDWVDNRIFAFGADKKLRVAVPDKHAHHLALGADGLVFFEHVTPDGEIASLWALDARGSIREVLPPRRRPDPAAYEGTVFAVGPGNELVYLRDCQIVRGAVQSAPSVWAGTSCGETAWKDEKVRYGHLHGSLAWGPSGAMYFSDSRTIRRVSREGAVTTLDGRPAGLFDPPLRGEALHERIMGLAADPAGNLYFALRDDRTIRKVSSDGRRTTFARVRGSWTPTGLTYGGGVLYVVAEPRMPPLRALLGSPRLLKVSGSGTVEVLATAP
jgi:sugar lactone lactonase YvrE